MKKAAMRPVALAILALALTLVLSSTALAAAPPVDVQRQSINGNEYIIKT